MRINLTDGCNIFLVDAAIAHFVALEEVMATDVQLKILLSYHYFSKQDLNILLPKTFKQPPKVFMDSGAYSAFSQGVAINIHDYAVWLLHNKNTLAVYSNLDVIGSAEATRKNQIILESYGLTPLPVFHTGEPWEYLEWYLERYQYIALGGMVPYSKKPKTLIPWLIKAFKMAKGRTVFHGFGCTNMSILMRFPWYSVDSSSWIAGVRYGALGIFDEASGTFGNMQIGNTKQVYRYATAIRQYGFQPQQFSNRALNTYNLNLQLPGLSFQNCERFLQKRHGQIKIPTIGGHV